MDTIYLDSAATTALDPEVAQGFAERQFTHFANPASLHPEGRKAHHLLEEARASLARQLGAQASELTFTSGGTEALGLALLGSAGDRPARIAVSPAEHAAVLETVLALERQGWQVDRVPVNTDGQITPEALGAVLKADTRLVIAMLANNEVGTINDIGALAKVVRAKAPRARLVVDAIQAFGKSPFTVKDLDADCVAITAHKLHGPKGVGALFSRTALKPILKGGGQEGGLRGGTQSAALAWAFAEAASRYPAARPRVAALRDLLFEALVARVPGLKLVGPPLDGPRVCHILNVCVPKLPSEPLQNALAERGVCASAGSACSGQKFSHVLTAMGRRPKDGAFIRLSVGRFSTESELIEAASRFADAVTELGAFYD